MRLQVEQLEKEKREGNERMRIIAKRLDHTERALRKAERPLLALDYDQQQTSDLAAHVELAKRRIALAREEHASALQTKEKLSRMMSDYVTRRADIAGKRGEEYARRREEAGRKVEEEKAKRRRAVTKAREEEKKKKEEEERIRREEEAEAARLEKGKTMSSAISFWRLCLTVH
jgi:translation initiation factor 3 subunit A